MKRKTAYISILLSCIILSCTCACTTTDGYGENNVTDNLSSKESFLLEDLEESGYEKVTVNGLSFEDIIAVYSDDFDSDGSKEAFIFTGNYTTDILVSSFSAELWFYNGSECEKISDEKTYLFNAQIQYFGETEILILTEHYTSSNITRFWGVENGIPYELNISGMGGDYELESLGVSYSESAIKNKLVPDVTFSLIDSQYDSAEAGGITCGHTYKKYYFFWSSVEKEFREYGGAVISESQLLKCDGAYDIVDRIENSGGVIGDIYYRDCGIININYSKVMNSSKDVNYYCITLRLNGNKIHFVSNGDGSFNDAMIKDIAVYPDDIPDFMKSE